MINVINWKKVSKDLIEWRHLFVLFIIGFALMVILPWKLLIMPHIDASSNFIITCEISKSRIFEMDGKRFGELTCTSGNTVLIENNDFSLYQKIKDSKLKYEFTVYPIGDDRYLFRKINNILI